MEISPIMKARGNSDVIFLQALGNRIAAMRKEKQITQSELGYRCDIEKQSINRIEAGNTNPTILTLQKIATALEIPLEELLKAKG